MRPTKICRLAASALFLGALTLFLITGPASATIDVAGWAYHNLSTLNVPITFGLAFDDQKIAWPKYDGTQSDVYVTDIATGVSTRITDTPGTERAVALDGSRLVWVAYADPASFQSGDVHLYDLGTHEDTIIAHGGIGTDSGPQIVGGYVAWDQHEQPAPEQPGTRRLYLYSISSRTTVLVSEKPASGGGNSGGQRAFALGPSYLAYVEAGSPHEDGEVWLVNLSTLERTKVGSSAADSLHVSLAGDLVTWAARGEGPSKGNYQPHDVLVYRISTQETKKVATRYAPEPFPKTDGRFVVWDTYTGSPVYTENLRQIRAYDSATGETIDVSHNLYLNFTPEIANGIVTWERGGEVDSVIMAHDLPSGQTTQLAADRGYMDQLSQVHGRTVVWWGLQYPSDFFPDVLRFEVAKAPDSYADPFQDVSGIHRYRTAILGVSDKGIATGYAMGAQRLFRSEAPLLRAQFAKMVAEAFSVPVTEDMVSPFADLGPDDPSNLYPHEYVAVLSARGIIHGITAQRFDPYAPLTRAQAASILVRTLDILYPGLVTNVEGQAPGAQNWGPPHGTNLRRAYANSLLVSLIDWVKPWDAVIPCSRGEAAQMLWNALELVDQEGR